MPTPEESNSHDTTTPPTVTSASAVSTANRLPFEEVETATTTPTNDTTDTNDNTYSRDDLGIHFLSSSSPHMMSVLLEEQPYMPSSSPPPSPPPPPPVAPPSSDQQQEEGTNTNNNTNSNTNTTNEDIFRAIPNLSSTQQARFEYQTRALRSTASATSMNSTFDVNSSWSLNSSRAGTPVPTTSKHYPMTVAPSPATSTGADSNNGAGAGAGAGGGGSSNNNFSTSTLLNNNNNNTISNNTTSTMIPKPNLKKQYSTFIPLIAAAEPPDPHSKDASERIRLGICAMDKKARSKPMAEILSRLDDSLFHVVFFGNDLIQNQPIEDWPDVQVLIAFFSKGFPLQKAKEYVTLRKPFCLNNLDMQEQLKDRRRVYDLLEASGIDVPRHVFVSRDGYESSGTGDGDRLGEKTVMEYDDHIEINGKAIHKPFVEKPVDADDHNIAIYYPTSAGGGCKKLFRKIGNRSSEFYPDINEVRRDGSYIYEEFVETQGTDVKMYTVGPEYGHAEARKSPTVDGKVQRNEDGKEIRFPVILTLSEKEIARRIVLQFKQFVCGFDLLRVQEGHSVVSYVCDVNGFSFVKNSRKYYDDCAQILTEHMLAAVKPNSLKGFSTLDPLVKTVDDEDSLPGFFSMRPGTTLQRVARLLTHQPSQSTMNDSTDDNDNNNRGSLSPSRSEHSVGVLSTTTTEDPTTLEEGALPVRQIPQELISEPASLQASRHNSSEDLRRQSVGSSSRKGTHREELRCVIAVVRHGDRTPKQKLKVNMSEPLILQYFHDHCANENCYTKDLKVKAKTPLTEFVVTVKTILATYEQKAMGGEAVDKKMVAKLRHMRDVLERWKITGLNRKLQIKPREFEDDPVTLVKRCTEVQLILKWGGNLTKLGENQAIRLGQQFRQKMYPDAPGGGILRLHSTFRHDLKIKTSDEGRVMKTAAAFAKGLLELEGEIPPILVSLVHKEKGSMHMLDPSGDKDAKLELDDCKEKITANLQQDIDWREMTEADRTRMVGPPELTSMRDALAEVGNPRKTLHQIYDTMGYLIEQLDEMLGLVGSGDEKRIEGGEGLKGEHDNDLALSGVKLYKGETLLELTERWKFIHKRLYDPDEDTFDLSRIPDVHDNVRFDVLHNPHLGLTSTLEKLYTLAKSMADTVVPQEYGTTVIEKRSVGIKICSPLLEKIRFDLNIARTDNKVDMRYMINMEYSADLPINTMGRRIRTRLYFTSESHLHTMLNVLRFASSETSTSGCESFVLSESGMQLLNDTREICYLTQIVIRLFEDVGRSMDDPRRFRVEILFSAGATATPLHISESTREADTSRLDTEALHPIGRDNLTCTEVEDFFASIISERGHGDDNFDVASIASTAARKDKGLSKGAGTVKKPSKDQVDRVSSEIIKSDKKLIPAAEVETSHLGSVQTEESTSVIGQDKSGRTISTNETETSPTLSTSAGITESSSHTIESRHTLVTSDSADTIRVSNSKQSGIQRGSVEDAFRRNDEDPNNGDLNIESIPNTEAEEDSDDDKAARDVTHKYFYITVAMGTLLLGASCLIMAIGLSGGKVGGARYNRRFTR